MYSVPSSSEVPEKLTAVIALTVYNELKLDGLNVTTGAVVSGVVGFAST